MSSVSPQHFSFLEESVKEGEYGEMAQRFREPFTLTEDPGLIPSTAPCNSGSRGSHIQVVHINSCKHTDTCMQAHERVNIIEE